MILSSLVKYYETLASDGKIEKNGWNKARISFCLNLDRDGNLIGVSDVRESDTSGKKPMIIFREMAMPAPVKRAVNIASNFLWDNSSYIIGADEKGKPKRSIECFEACRKKHEELLENVENNAAQAVLRYFRTWQPEKAAENPLLQEYWKELISGVNITFRVDGSFVSENAEIRQAWDAYYSRGQGQRGLCSVTGTYDEIARLHPSVKGVPGAQSSGASLVSFNAPAYCSYGKEQGANSPVGESAAFAYTSALNYLIADYQHRESLGDMTVVYWSQSGKQEYQDLFSVLWNAGGDGIDETVLNSVMHKLAKGQAIDWEAVEIRPEDEFYILGLSPNAARLSVRFFLRSTFGKVAENLSAHYENIRIVHGAKSKDHLSLENLISETVSQKSKQKKPAPSKVVGSAPSAASTGQKSKEKKPSPQLAGALARAVLEGLPYPATLYNGIQLRIRAEREVNYRRAAVIKAYLMRNGSGIDKEVLTVKLNDESNYIPYILGRLFSVLEGLQDAANPGINTTICDRYFNSACATPAVVFPILLKLSQNHSKKLSVRLKVYYEKQITELMGRFVEPFPERLNLKEQGVFQLGYYHQTQKRFEKRR